MVPVDRAWRGAGLLLVCTGLLAACQPTQEEPMLGTLEWDRIAVPAEASEVVRSLAVREGESVQAGQLLLTLDGRRAGARVAQAQAALAQQEARVSELVHGTRSETLEAARAAVASARASEVEADRQFARQSQLATRQLVARASLDAARASRDRARAQVAESQARLHELTRGTRSEQLAQAEAALDAARAALEAAQLDQARLHSN